MGLVVQDQPQGWSIDLTRFHGPNTMSYKIITSGKRTPLIGAHLSTSTMENLPDLEEELTRFHNQYLLVLGDLKYDINQDHNTLSQ